MKNKIVYVRRKKSTQSIGTWANFCKTVNCGQNEVFSGVVKSDDPDRIHMYDGASGNPWIFRLDQFDIVNEANPVYKPLDNGVDEKHTVFRPKHYEILDKPSIEVLACSMTPEEWRGFCMGNILKYRIRAGKKDSLEQDIGKANEYETIYAQYKHLCRQE